MTLNDRALLLAYPAWFRRRYGDEILTTMMEMGPPTRHDRLRLITDGIAQRFRLSPHRPVAVLATVLIAVTAGAFGAAAGSWAAERTYASPPPLRQLARQITGGTPFNDGFYHTAAHGFRMKTTTVMISRWDTGAVVAALREAGWTVTADGVQNNVRLALAVRNPAHPGTPTTDLHEVLLPGNGFWENPMSQSWLLPGLSLAGAALTLATLALLGRTGNNDEAIPLAG